MVEIDFLKNDEMEIGTLADWIYGEWGFQNSTYSATKFADKLRLRAENKDIPFTLVAKADGIYAGTASVVRNELAQFPQYFPWLAGVFVPPKWRSKGIANALCSRADQIVKQLGYEQYYLFTYATERYYLPRGWERLIEADNLGTQGVVMRKIL